LFTEEDLDVSLGIVGEGGEVELPVIVVKEAETDAEAVTHLWKLFLFFVRGSHILRILLILLAIFISFQIDEHRSALAAVNAVFNGFPLSIWLLLDGYPRIIIVICGRPVEKHPAHENPE